MQLKKKNPALYCQSPSGEWYTSPFFMPSCVERPLEKKAYGEFFAHALLEHEFDEGIGLNYAGARFYDPEVGLWISPDAARQYHSLYTYCGNNPVGCFDPDGNVGIEDRVRNLPPMKRTHVIIPYADTKFGFGASFKIGGTGFSIDLYTLTQHTFSGEQTISQGVVLTTPKLGKHKNSIGPYRSLRLSMEEAQHPFLAKYDPRIEDVSFKSKEAVKIGKVSASSSALKVSLLNIFAIFGLDIGLKAKNLEPKPD